MRSFFDRWVGEFCLILFALVCAGVAQAQEPPGTRPTPCHLATPNNAVCVLWAAPEVNDDGTPIVLPLTYRVERQQGTSWAALATTAARMHYVTGLAPGTHTFRVIAITDKESLPSNSASRAVPTPSPTAPVIQVVQVVIGVDHAPVFTVLADGARSTTVGGFAAVGTACEGPVLFRYRNRDYRRPVTFKPWSTSAAARVAAPCS